MTNKSNGGVSISHNMKGSNNNDKTINRINS